MALIPTIKKLLKEDFPSDVTWLGKLLLPLNSFIETTVNALNGNLTIGDNVAGKLAQVTVYKGQTVPVSFKWAHSMAPVAVVIGSARIKDAVTGVSLGQTLGSPEWYYDATSRSVVITRFPGLTLPDATNTYVFIIIAIPGAIT